MSEYEHLPLLPDVHFCKVRLPDTNGKILSHSPDEQLKYSLSPLSDRELHPDKRYCIHKANNQPTDR